MTGPADRTAIVTGVSRRSGIGAAVAQRLAAEGPPAEEVGLDAYGGPAFDPALQAAGGPVDLPMPAVGGPR